MLILNIQDFFVTLEVLFQIQNLANKSIEGDITTKESCYNTSNDSNLKINPKRIINIMKTNNENENLCVIPNVFDIYDINNTVFEKISNDVINVLISSLEKNFLESKKSLDKKAKLNLLKIYKRFVIFNILKGDSADIFKDAPNYIFLYYFAKATYIPFLLLSDKKLYENNSNKIEKLADEFVQSLEPICCMQNSLICFKQIYDEKKYKIFKESFKLFLKDNIDKYSQKCILNSLSWEKEKIKEQMNTE